ncbi:hypothetical protein CMI42_05740 [Candidatus Pacearchaeota archaeon]|nr:hypothetical protein [Candidatus Pacearchaeota archaeon]|tara:strand:- start:83 stop:589 length:507 start_codon:yes stop_codon:yes gene_type:complete
MEKKTIYLLSFLVIIISVLIAGGTLKILREQPAISITSQELIIKTGTSFGECLGYCEEDITIVKENIVFHKNGRGQDDLFPEVTEEVPISPEQWNALLNSLDLEKFSSLDDVIGCPDCADGGAEWIEIDNGETTKKVTFEYGDSISEIDSFILSLRKIREDVFSQFKD